MWEIIFSIGGISSPNYFIHNIFPSPAANASGAGKAKPKLDADDPRASN